MSLNTLERIASRNVELRGFLVRLIDPEDLGHAVSAEVRAEACQLLGLVPSKERALAHYSAMARKATGAQP